MAPPNNFGNYFDESAANQLPGKGWDHVLGNDGYPWTSPVGTYPANRYGLYDMSGNVWQWCEDWYRKEMALADVSQIWPYLKEKAGEKQCRVLRGGSWYTRLWRNCSPPIALATHLITVTTLMDFAVY